MDEQVGEGWMKHRERAVIPGGKHPRGVLNRVDAKQTKEVREDVPFAQGST